MNHDFQYGGVNVPHFEQYTGPWAMPLERFDEMAALVRAASPHQHVVETQAAAEKRRAEGKAAHTWRDEAEMDAHGYQVLEGGVAVVDLVGMMTKYGGSFSAMPGGTIGLQRVLRTAAADPKVSSIVLRIDSPGGNVAGSGDLAATVGQINAKKPVVAFLEDLAASAAYYVASQAGTLIATKDTLVGSIGVYMVIDDWSGFFADAKVKRHVIKAGKLKGAGVTGTEITEEQLADFQRTVNDINDVFVSAVAKGRGIEKAKALELADGRVHIAGQAKKLGLIDQVGTFEGAVSAARRRGAEPVKGSKADTAAAHGTADIAVAQDENGASERRSDGATATQSDNLKETIMPNETQAASPAAGPRPASIAELKKALPDSTAEFRESWLEMGATVTEATALWADELRKQNQAQQAKITELQAAMDAHAEKAKAAAKKPGVEAPGFDAGSTGIAGGAGDARGKWDAAIAEKVKAGVDPTSAARHVNRENPGLREAMIGAHNATHLRRVA
jgi:signal peptide peptidase SppA